ncbi:MAG: glycosyltransferase family 39 protein [Candidatus Gottesmanbacteria bacterium]|nr:glycosyltransferase family 39 protein [Candidatus Gottesmanbacteria bacterium]
MGVYKKIIAVTIILFIAATLRFYKLGIVPTSLNADEVAIGYNAYSILKTGKDEYGKKFPLLFQSFDDFKMPVYIYLTVPSIAMFGLNDFSVRLPSAVLGTVTVYLTYVLVESLFASASIGLIASFLLAISPWHLQFSRSAYEANIAVFFTVFGIMLLLKALKKNIFYIPAFFILALSVWSYHSSRVFIPIFIVGYFVINYREIIQQKKYFIAGIIVFILLCTPLLKLSLSPEGLVRARGVSALGDVGPLNRTISWRQTDETLGIPFPAIVHNRRFADIPTLLKGYLSHFDPNFFFSEIVQGKYHVPGFGLMYLWELPVLLYGLFAVANKKGKSKYILFLWFFAAPIAASPTRMLPHPVRTLVFLPTLQIFVAIGLFELYRKLESMKATFRIPSVGIGVAIIVFSGLFYLHQYYIHMPVEYASEWQYGHEQAVGAVKLMQDKFDKIIVSTSLDQPYIFFLYYLKYDPAKYLASGGTKSGKFDEERNAFDKYEFHTYMNTGVPLDPRVLYVGSPTEVLPGAVELVAIPYPTGETAYVISAEISKKNWNEAGNVPYLH